MSRAFSSTLMTVRPFTVTAVVAALLIGLFAGSFLAKSGQRQREDLEERQIAALEVWARRDCDPEGKRIWQRAQEILEEVQR